MYKFKKGDIIISKKSLYLNEKPLKLKIAYTTSDSYYITGLIADESTIAVPRSKLYLHKNYKISLKHKLSEL